MNPKIYLMFVMLTGLPRVSGLLGFIGAKQSAGAQGNLTCGGLPAKNITVTLYDGDLMWDSKMDEAQTSNDGTFELHGSKREVTKIEPYLEISHHCRVKEGCAKTVKMEIPLPFVFKGSDIDVHYPVNIDLAKHNLPSTLECH
ncbi:hypothetical protein KIN20_000775 [Parelaphostrongylus tenuis]|uniref:Uncharacterized protein n=1 Tax=Parelaphostrongylus tenuis TaxID=148309 RepID=A0AAD5LVZ9_PARTN|nr:hypothetical protein KIN20_000775 [Parelaphostrongylus tenuis]